MNQGCHRRLWNRTGPTTTVNHAIRSWHHAIVCLPERVDWRQQLCYFWSQERGHKVDNEDNGTSTWFAPLIHWIELSCERRHKYNPNYCVAWMISSREQHEREYRLIGTKLAVVASPIKISHRFSVSMIGSCCNAASLPTTSLLIFF